MAGIDTGTASAPHDVLYAGGKLYFTAEGYKSIGRYDPVANSYLTLASAPRATSRQGTAYLNDYIYRIAGATVSGGVSGAGADGLGPDSSRRSGVTPVPLGWPEPAKAGTALATS